MKIEVYTKPSCTYCINAKMFLQSKGLEYTEIKIGTDISREDFLAKFPPKAPQVVIDGVTIGGYEDTRKYFA